MSWVAVIEVVLGVAVAVVTLATAYEKLPWVATRRKNERIAADKRTADIFRDELVRTNAGSSVMDRLNTICERLDEGSKNFHDQDRRLVAVETELKVTRHDSD